jgi:alanyl-tRNA synthetase
MYAKKTKLSKSKRILLRYLRRLLRLHKRLLNFQELAEKTESGVFSGEDAPYLYTTMGFPVDLTELMAEERGMSLDKSAFEARM